MAARRKKTLDAPEAFSLVLDRILSRAGGGPKGDDVKDVWAAWDAAAGPWAEIARPEGLRNGVLIASVESAAHSQELQFEKDDIRRRLNESLGREAVTEIRFRVGRPKT